MFQEKLDNLNNSKKASIESCSVCRELLANLEQFFSMLETTRRTHASDWLTVDDISKEFPDIGFRIGQKTYYVPKENYVHKT